MKKENKNKNNELFEAFLPDRTKEDPNENLKKEKKLYSIIFIVICVLLLVSNLIAMIINFCVSLAEGFSSLFVGFINCTISIFLLGLLIVMAHNLSKMTRATLFICSKLMRDEKRLLEAEKNKAEEESNDNSNDDNLEQKTDSEAEEEIKAKEKLVIDDKDDIASVSVEIVEDDN